VIADLHAHYPMHVVGDVTPATTVDLMQRVGDWPGLVGKGRALVLSTAIRLFSDRDWWSGHRVTVPYLREGGVGLLLSALYGPFQEMDLARRYASPPSPQYFGELLEDLAAVEREVTSHGEDTIRVVRDRAALDRCIDDGAIALVHAVEGGFHLGDRPDEIAANVATLAEKGVAYVTLAHLFFRQIATNANAVPFLPDKLYDAVFPQSRDTHVTERGVAAIRAMVEHRVIVDISHMRPDAVAHAFRLLDEADPGRTMPVISSHAGYRFGTQEYMHDDAAVRLIAERDGVIGLIMAQHQLNDGVRKDPTTTLEESLQVVFRHVDELAELTGGHRHVALGTDFDGFIKPTLAGLDDMRALTHVERELRARYGDADADLVLWENALRVLRKAWAT
jgi:microsomal dipeptidase-like Zn-dependent dipeptidase